MLSHPAASKGPRTVPGWSAPPEVPPESFTPSILRADPPDHTRMRGLMNRSFTPGRVDGLRPRMLFAETSLNEAVERRSRAVWLSAVRRISWGIFSQVSNRYARPVPVPCSLAPTAIVLPEMATE